MAIRFKLFSPNTVLSADDMNDVAANGVVTIATTADLDDPDLADVNVVYVQAETKLRVRKSAGLGVAHWSSPFDSLVPDAAATITHSGTLGLFNVTNYNPEYHYSATTSAGSVTVNNTGSACSIQSSGTTTATITLKVKIAADFDEFKTTVFERKPYTYHDTGSQCTNWTGPDEFGWWYCTAHAPANWVKDATPSGYSDSGNEWWKVVSYS